MVVSDGYDSSLKRIYRGFKSQHILDLNVYRRAHQNWYNRVLHWILIPLECWSALCFCMILLSLPIGAMISILLGIQSLFLSTKLWIGIITFLFHLWTIVTYIILRQYLADDSYILLLLILIVWVIAWTLQIVIGHWICEKNQPNIANKDDNVSYLAMCQSVLIAWSS